MGERRRVSFFLDSDLEAGLKALRGKVGIPQAEAIRRAIAQYLERQGIDLEWEVLKRTPVNALTPLTPPNPTRVTPSPCRRCAHPEASHWARGCVAGCLCRAFQ